LEDIPARPVAPPQRSPSTKRRSGSSSTTPSHKNVGKARQDPERPDGAIAEPRAANRLNPDDALAHNNPGKALHDQGKLAEAIIEFKKAIELNPDDALSHSRLGYVLHGQGLLADAIIEYKEATRLKPDDAKTHNSLAWALVLSPKRPRPDYDEGLMHARRAVELEPNEWAHISTLALAECRSHHWAESLAASGRSMGMENNGIAYDLFPHAVARWQKGDKDEARKWLDKAIAGMKEKDAKNKELLQLWAEAAELLGQPGPGTSGAGSPTAPGAEKPHWTGGARSL
jgi:tetratricopeptide (TPR) repeat protein